MPKRQPSTLDALAEHQEQQRVLTERGDVLRRAAALDLGTLVLDAGGAALGRDGVRRAVEIALGASEPSRAERTGRTDRLGGARRSHDAG